MNDFNGERIGILGGTFNPIHIGHLILAENAYNDLQLDKVIFMPTGVSYLKDQSKIVSKEDRLKMTELAIADNPHFELSDYEVKKNGNTYTADTLDELKELYPDKRLFFIIGEDSLFDLDKWYKPHIICSKASLIVARRYNSNNEVIEKAIKKYVEKYDADINLLQEPEIAISSTMLRERIIRGCSLKYYLTDNVIQYIKENRLYVR